MCSRTLLTRIITAGISPCPNDMFCFESWALGEIGEEIPLRLQIADLDELHARAKSKSPYMLTKLSTACFAHLAHHYVALSVGGAFATSCGPKLVAKKAHAPLRRLAIPGLDTSAYSAFQMLYGAPFSVAVLPFREIVPAVMSGDFDAGILIHETGSVVKNYGLIEIADIGHEYVKRFGELLPLGVIAVQKSLPSSLISAIQNVLQVSIQRARMRSHVTPFIQDHAHELSADTVWQHIETYVSNDTYQMSEKAQRSINLFIENGIRHGLFPPSAAQASIFYRDHA